MRRVGVVLAATAAAFAFAPAAEAGQCGLPSAKPLWVDVVGGPFWKKIFARPGLNLAVSSVSPTGGPDVPTQLRAAGAKTVHWDNYLRKRVGTPTNPLDPATVPERGNSLFDYAVKVTGCRTPLIGINELYGAYLATPWSPAYAQYRENVLIYVRTLAARGARPFLAVPNRPYSGGEAAEWWRQVAQVSDIVREVYFPAPRIARAGPVLGNRILRNAFRRSIVDFTRMGVPVERLGLFLGFQTTPGKGGREQLEPEQAWFRTVKWQALAAREVAREMRISSIWSWGWNSWSTTPKEMDPDKEAAACVYLWARRRSLCDGPAAAGAGFNASLKEGQLRLPSGVQCIVGTAAIRINAINRHAAVTGDRQAAITALLSRVVLTGKVELKAKEIDRAERAVVESRFGGRRSAYLAAVRRAGAKPDIVRAALADDLRRQRLAEAFKVVSPSSEDVQDYYATYGETLARRVEVKPAALWLGRKTTGVALAGAAPTDVFKAPTNRWRTLETSSGKLRFRALERVVPLARIPLEEARPAIRAALADLARSEAADRWLLRAQGAALNQTICRRDDLPTPGLVDVTTYLDFLNL